MSAERAFSKIQYGKETISTHGTAVAATRILQGATIKAIVPDRKPRYPEDALGVRAKGNRAVVDELFVTDTLSIPHLAFQHLPLIHSCGLKGNVTAGEVTPAQGDYLWTHTPSMTASNTPDSITLEAGDDTQAFESEYVMFSRFRISGEVSQDGGAAPITAEVDYFGRQWTPTTFTSAPALITLETMNAKFARVYLDPLWANRGTTELANTLRKFELEVITGVHPKFFGSANRYFDVYGESWIEAMLTLSLEGNANADSILDTYFRTYPPTPAAYGIKISGAQIGSGTNHAYNAYIWGVPDIVRPLDSESNGNNVTQVLIHGLYGTTGTQIFDANITTSINAI